MRQAPPPEMQPRLHSLDGLRGVLAFIVVVNHVLLVGAGSNGLFWAGRGAVLIFFAMSAHVLVRAWPNQNFAVFLVKRAVRLWPVFAVCLAGGALVQNMHAPWAWFWWGDVNVAADWPAWSLVIEARAMVFMPILVWAATGSVLRPLSLALLWGVLTGWDKGTGFGWAFLLGARLSRFDFHAGLLETPVPQFLGRISYSLYLVHWIVLVLGVRWLGLAGAVAGLPVSIAAGWVVWFGLEQPSIRWSRAVGRRSRPSSLPERTSPGFS